MRPPRIVCGPAKSNPGVLTALGARTPGRGDRLQAGVLCMLVAREPLSLHVIIVVLVRRGFRYLLVRDDKRGATWYPPAGQMNRGEDLLTAAARIARDRAGVEVQVTGIVSLTHMPILPGHPAARLRFVVEAKLRNGNETDPGYPKGYYLPSEIEGLPLRGDDAAEIIAAHSQGRPVAPIEIYSVGF